MTILWGFFSVFPANAGMILAFTQDTIAHVSVPRECGDDPFGTGAECNYFWCSPRMRG